MKYIIVDTKDKVVKEVIHNNDDTLRNYPTGYKIKERRINESNKISME